MDSSLPEIDVCIVGAGLAGLSAAYKILSKESTLKIIILENEARIGGELYSTAIGELGGKWFTPDQYHIHDLCKKLNVPVTRREPAEATLKPYWGVDKGPLANLSRFEVKRFINELNIKTAYFYPGTFKLSNNDDKMEKVICSKLFFEQSREFIRCFVRFIAGVEAKDVSYIEFMSICHGCGNLAELIALFTGTSSIIYEFSSELLLQKLEKIINTYHIFLRTNVIEVKHYINYALIRDDRNNVFRATMLIMAVPWQITQRIIFYPPIPEELRVPVFEGKYMITSFLTQYRESYWRRAGFSGSLIMHNPHMICYEYRPLFYGGIIAHDEDFDKILEPIVLKRLADIFGPEMSIPIVWHQKTWEQSTLLNLPATTAWNQIIWSSTTSATCYRGFLSGAVQSGYRAALHALLSLRPQNVGWQDINEIQKASAVRRRPGWLVLSLSSLNLYNSGFYFIMAGLLIVSCRFINALFQCPNSRSF